MAIIRLTKEFNFEASHALWNYDGKCKNLHGHSYILFVTVIGSPIKDSQNVKNGMVMDFGDLKKLVNELIVDKFDHSVILNEKAKFTAKTCINLHKTALRAGGLRIFLSPTSNHLALIPDLHHIF